eukprot:NODE_1627_length_1657_cov_180.219035_g1548_i0.p1 GENE.NODE_1627_length_1657_cov_180.219035_g1548_i0~~NODE_1627_length_1657_cov_180.219035_g1548_i0.p1  ORF type:complete len:478 (-),score=141.81 NODE_1627_length_1657_cov_180.219035_g1548_i0:222-1601(-)
MTFRRVALVASLLTSTLASENGGYYQCNTALLASDNYCLFERTTTAPFSTVMENPVDRTIAPDYYRMVADSTGAQLAVSPKPWTNGDQLAISSTKLTGSSQNYALAFELVAPLRNTMMYRPKEVIDSATQWAKLTKAFTDCNIKIADETNSAGHVGLSTDNVYASVKNPNNMDNHHYILQYLEEGAVDLVCLMTDLNMDRCDTIRAAQTPALESGTVSMCWLDAYVGMYGGTVDDIPYATDLGTTTVPGATGSTSASGSAPVSGSAPASGSAQPTGGDYSGSPSSSGRPSGPEHEDIMDLSMGWSKTVLVKMSNMKFKKMFGSVESPVIPVRAKPADHYEGPDFTKKDNRGNGADRPTSYAGMKKASHQDDRTVDMSEGSDDCVYVRLSHGVFEKMFDGPEVDFDLSEGWHHTVAVRLSRGMFIKLFGSLEKPRLPYMTTRTRKESTPRKGSKGMAKKQ